MRQRSNQSIECSRGEQWRRGGSSEGRLQDCISGMCINFRDSSPTQWLLLEDEEHSVNQFEVLGEVVQLFRVSTLQNSRLNHGMLT